MNDASSSVSILTRVAPADLFALFARWLLGAAFVYLGINKAMHPVEFLKLVRQYDVLSNVVLLNSTAALLPWFEIFCGILLLLGVAVRGAAAMLLVMLVTFFAAIMIRALAIRDLGGLPFCAIKFDCGCGAGEVFVCRKLAENFLLMFLSAALLFVRSDRLCLRRNLL
jgi:uncharacterized membrane protein YphA (DoxX/SURF4 family)